MDYDKLIERLRTDSLYADKASLEIMDLCMEAATAIETLRAENAKLKDSRDRWKKCAEDSGRKESRRHFIFDRHCHTEENICREHSGHSTGQDDNSQSLSHSHHIGAVAKLRH